MCRASVGQPTLDWKEEQAAQGQRSDSAFSQGGPSARSDHKSSCAVTVHQQFLKLGQSQIPAVRQGSRDRRGCSCNSASLVDPATGKGRYPLVPLPASPTLR